VYQIKVVNDDVAQRDLSRKTEYFNKQQRKTRRVIERVFGKVARVGRRVINTACRMCLCFCLCLCRVCFSPGIVKAMWQGLKMRTLHDREQKVRDTYCAFILYNMCLEAKVDLEHQYDWEKEVEEKDLSGTPPEQEGAAKSAGQAYRTQIIEQMWVNRAARKAAGV
jgi:hypothetical protein